MTALESLVLEINVLITKLGDASLPHMSGALLSGNIDTEIPHHPNINGDRP